MGRIIAAGAVAAVAVALVAVAVILRVRYRRSLAASLCEWYLRATERKMNTAQAEADLKRLSCTNNDPCALPRRLRARGVEYRLHGMQTYVFGNEDASRAVLYLHGSGYVHQPRKQHFIFAELIARRTGGAVWMPIYPKAPQYGWREVYGAVQAVYAELRARYTELTLMGDSSGGGLALGLGETLCASKQAQPDRYVLLSPWVDLALKNCLIPQFEPTDPIETVEAARVWGRCYAQGENLRNEQLSPIHGDMAGLAPILLTVGTRELLYPDVKLLALILRDSRVRVELEIGTGLNHVYPIFPIPEARKTQARIADWIGTDQTKEKRVRTASRCDTTRTEA